MATNGVPPIFFSGPRLKIKFNGKEVAHAIGLNYNVSCTAQHIHTLASYGPVAVQKLLFNGVDGTLQILQVAPAEVQNKKITNAKTLNNQRVDPTDPVSALGSGSTNNSPLMDPELAKQFNPAKILLSSTFDIDVYQMYPKKDGSGVVEIKQFTLKNCRFSQRQGSIALGQLVNQTLSFQGLLLQSLSPNLNNENIGKIIESLSITNSTDPANA